jgi:hypothetical protein
VSDRTDLEPEIRAERHFEPDDRMIAALARRQWGMVSRAQLAAVGLGRRAIGHRLEIGRLHRVHRGVYAVGHRPHSNESRWMAAVLAVDGAVFEPPFRRRLLGASFSDIRTNRGYGRSAAQESRGNCRPPRSAPGR